MTMIPMDQATEMVHECVAKCYDLLKASNDWQVPSMRQLHATWKSRQYEAAREQMAALIGALERETFAEEIAYVSELLERLPLTDDRREELSTAREHLETRQDENDAFRARLEGWLTDLYDPEKDGIPAP